MTLPDSPVPEAVVAEATMVVVQVALKVQEAEVHILIQVQQMYPIRLVETLEMVR